MTDRFVTEITATVFDTTTKHHIVVGEDGDAMDLVELTYVPRTGDGETIKFPWIDTGMARELAKNLIMVADHIDARSANNGRRI